MKRFLKSVSVITGLAIFTMLFGAGNLMYPLKVGIMAGDRTVWAVLAFSITAIILPILGLIGSLLFYGDYHAYFGRIGKVPGFLLTLFCILAIGPLFIIPRIITFSYEMLHPFFPTLSLLVFTGVFIAATFICTYRPSKLLTLLGSILGPLKLGLLGTIILKGIFQANTPTQVTNLSFNQLFLDSFLYGYNTLDLLGTIFFASIIFSVLKKNLSEDAIKSSQTVLKVALRGAVIGSTILGGIYVSLSFLGAMYGADLLNINEGQIFRTVVLRIIGTGGTALMGAAVTLACFSTAVALSAVVGQYVHETVSNKKLNYVTSLALVLLIALIPSNLGLTTISRVSLPLIKVMYPVLITLTLCNIGYKLFGFKPVKIPVLVAFILSLSATFLW